MLSKSTIVLLVAILALAAGLYWWTGRVGEVEAPEDAYPPGRWMRVGAPALGEGEEGEEMARVLSLPYLQGKMVAGETSGVVTHDADRAYPGLNLYCSGHAPEAILMDMEGQAVHRWRQPFRRAFPDKRPNIESTFFRRVALLPEGELLALFHGSGLVKLDRDSKLIWASEVPGYNDFFVEPDGRILVLSKDARIIPEINPDEPVLEDFLVELGPDGREIGRTSLLAAFRTPPWDRLLGEMRDEGDILHSNTVTRITGTAGEPPLSPGNLLVSLREVGALGVLDPAGERLLWGRTGPWRAQHEPVLTSRGTLLVFDNKGGPDESTRVLELDPGTGEILWSHGEGATDWLISPEGGTVAELPNGNVLITASEGGRVIELEPGGDIVWEFLSPHRAGPEKQLVATLWEMQRLEPGSVDWLD